MAFNIVAEEVQGQAGSARQGLRSGLLPENGESLFRNLPVVGNKRSLGRMAPFGNTEHLSCRRSAVGDAEGFVEVEGAEGKEH